MGEKIYDVEIIVTKSVRVRVPDDVLTGANTDPEEAAEEFAIGGKGSWPKYVISEIEDWEVDSVREVKTVAVAV